MFNGWFRRISVVDLIKASREVSNSASNLKSGSSGDGNEQSAESATPLKRVYKLTDLVYLGICNVVGSGIYVMAGSAGKEDAGSGLLISLCFGLCSAGLSALCFGMTYFKSIPTRLLSFAFKGFNRSSPPRLNCLQTTVAEFASRIPVIGGSYVYMYSSSGELIGFLCGFIKVITQMCSCALNAIGAIAYLRSFIQSLYNNDASEVDVLDESIFFGKSIYGEIVTLNLLAPFLIFIFMSIVLYDIGLSSKFMNIAATWNILLLLLFVVSGLMMFDMDILTKPCNPDIVASFDNIPCPEDANNSFLPYGFEGVIAASTLTFWSFAGSENIASVAEEAVNPTRDIPRAIMITLCIVFVLFQGITLSLMGMVPFQALDESAALAQAFAFHDELLLQRICAFGAFTTMSVLLFAKIIAAPRYLFRIGVDGLLCRWTAFVHPQQQSPFNAILIFGIVAMFIATFFDLGSVLTFAATTTLLEYTLVGVGVLVMRYCPPSLPSINGNENERDNDHGNGGDEVMFSARKISDIQLTPFWTDRRVFLLIWSYFVTALITAYIGFSFDYIHNEMGLELLYVMMMILGSGMLMIGFGIVVYLDVTLPWKDWIRGGRDAAKSITFVPLSPFTPLILILINCSLIASGGVLLLLQVMGLVLVGFVIYVAYGFNHSKLGNKYRLSLLEMK